MRTRATMPPLRIRASEAQTPASAKAGTQPIQGTTGQRQEPKTLRVWLPWPPSANHRLAHCRGRVYVLASARRWRQDAHWLLVGARMRASWPEPTAAERYTVRLDATPPPPRRRRDLDNLAKETLDALTTAGLIADDSAVDLLVIARRNEPTPGITVELSTAAATAAEGSPNP